VNQYGTGVFPAVHAAPVYFNPKSSDALFIKYHQWLVKQLKK